MMKRKLLLGASLFFFAIGAQAQDLNDARKAIEQEQFAKAKNILKTLVQKQPKKGINNFYLGQVYIQNDYLDSAKMSFDQGLANDPKTNLNEVGLATLELLKGNTAAAESKFTSVLSKTKKKDYWELYFTGKAYLDAPTPDYGKALNYLLQAKERGGKKIDPIVFIALGDAYLGASDPNKAYNSYSDAVYANPDLTKGELQMAVIIRNSRAWQDAIDAFLKITQEKPNYAPTYRELAQTYNYWALVSATDTATYRDLNRTAVKYYKQYMDLTDYSVDSRIKYADFLVFAGDYEELRNQARELSQLEDVNPKVLRYLGHSCYHQEDYASAVDAMSKFMDRIEEDRVIALDHLFYGQALLHLASSGESVNQEQFAKGIAEIKAAVAMEKESADNLNEFGLLFFKQGKYAEAAKVFEISSNVEGSRNQVTDTYYFALSSYYSNAFLLNSGQPVDKEMVAKADKAFVYVSEKAPELLEPYLFYARNKNLLEDSQNPQGVANEAFLKYAELVKSKGAEEVQKNKSVLIEIYNRLTFFYYQKSNFAEVEKYVNMVLELDPNESYANQVKTFLIQKKEYDAKKSK